MNILGIETSCDETSAAIIKDGLLLSNIVYSQKIHIKYGGVVPEYASREHEKNLINTINESLNVAKIRMIDLDAIAVTYGPGLMGSLLVGLNMAKGLSIGLDITGSNCTAAIPVLTTRSILISTLSSFSFFSALRIVFSQAPQSSALPTIMSPAAPENVSKYPIILFYSTMKDRVDILS